MTRTNVTPAWKRYNATDRGKARQKKYEHSVKGRARQKTYRQSAKGKLARHRANRSLKGKRTKQKYATSAKGRAVTTRFQAQPRVKDNRCVAQQARRARDLKIAGVVMGRAATKEEAARIRAHMVRRYAEWLASQKESTRESQSR